MKKESSSFPLFFQRISRRIFHGRNSVLPLANIGGRTDGKRKPIGFSEASEVDSGGAYAVVSVHW
jgi:hypothetical protein